MDVKSEFEYNIRLGSHYKHLSQHRVHSLITFLKRVIDLFGSFANSTNNCRIQDSLNLSPFSGINLLIS